MDGPAPAILNAVQDALGADVRRVPLLPEHLMVEVSHQRSVISHETE
jgi:CO/xanthine dehydrogenase Mo-binding subunit